MPKEFDTRWFDLKIYEPFKTISVETWIWQLEAREHYHKMAEHDRCVKTGTAGQMEIINRRYKKGN